MAVTNHQSNSHYQLIGFHLSRYVIHFRHSSCFHSVCNITPCIAGFCDLGGMWLCVRQSTIDIAYGGLYLVGYLLLMRIPYAYHHTRTHTHTRARTHTHTVHAYCTQIKYIYTYAHVHMHAHVTCMHVHTHMYQNFKCYLIVYMSQHC